MSASLNGPQPKYRHFVITRYFVRFSESPVDVAAVKSPNLAWLESRLEIFREICLPSVAAQTDQNFTWLLYFDVDTPPAYLGRVRELLSLYRNFRIVLCEAFDDQSRSSAILAELDPDTEWLLTTRLDNDDGWRNDFVERLHGALRFERRECLNFASGLIWHKGRTLLYQHPSNAFISMFEPVERFRTVWCAQHLDLRRQFPVRQIKGTPAFVQVIHDSNLSNKARGARIPAIEALRGFEATNLTKKADPRESRTGIALFNLTRMPVWTVRDAAAALIRLLRRM